MLHSEGLNIALVIHNGMDNSKIIPILVIYTLYQALQCQTWKYRILYTFGIVFRGV